MTVSGDKMPSERTLLTTLDTEARRTVQKAQAEMAPIIARVVPRKSGKTAGALRPKVSRTATGAALTVSPPRGKAHSGHGPATIAQVVRWVNTGTGLYRNGAGVKARIRGRRRGIVRGDMVLPGGKKVRSVKGQRPNPFMARIRAAGEVRVARIYTQGARDAARAVGRKF
jgi:hypothetical protein